MNDSMILFDNGMDIQQGDNQDADAGNNVPTGGKYKTIIFLCNIFM